MKFSAQEEYGLRCLLQIARSQESMTIPEIAKIEGLSQTHVAKLLMILRKEGFITSTRGQAGGYALAKSPSEINVGQVLESLMSSAPSTLASFPSVSMRWTVP